ncbi:hypothetical protein CIRG_06819 [Coccidioides immitis RMSCC 2394]|uniref:Uncharacterized protein n=1 Tax=Coccidioides immitis RMSCC 2394 TaxID=404692 RepID=A0A0J6YJN1_COCIT|nr:hypothetical protein CIRG_06819 [Coccidioides immitis RMSCC 2394]
MAEKNIYQINADDMKLILDISTITGLNYFSLIDISNYSTSAAPVSAIITYSFVQFIKPVLEKQKKKKKKKEKKKKKKKKKKEEKKKEKENYNNDKNNNNDKNDDNNNNDELTI